MCGVWICVASHRPSLDYVMFRIHVTSVLCHASIRQLCILEAFKLVDRPSLASFSCTFPRAGLWLRNRAEDLNMPKGYSERFGSAADILLASPCFRSVVDGWRLMVGG